MLSAPEHWSGLSKSSLLQVWLGYKCAIPVAVHASFFQFVSTPVAWSAMLRCTSVFRSFELCDNLKTSLQTRLQFVLPLVLRSSEPRMSVSSLELYKAYNVLICQWQVQGKLNQ